MRNPRDLVSHTQDFCGFLAGLVEIPPQVLVAPMAEEKWSVQEVVAHIMAYDEAFLRSVVLAIEDGRQPLVPDPADNQSFNDRAAALGRNLTKGQLLERATLARQAVWWIICGGCLKKRSCQSERVTRKQLGRATRHGLRVSRQNSCQTDSRILEGPRISERFTAG